MVVRVTIPEGAGRRIRRMPPKELVFTFKKELTVIKFAVFIFGSLASFIEFKHVERIRMSKGETLTVEARNLRIYVN